MKKYREFAFNSRALKHFPHTNFKAVETSGNCVAFDYSISTFFDTFVTFECCLVNGNKTQTWEEGKNWKVSLSNAVRFSLFLALDRSSRLWFSVFNEVGIEAVKVNWITPMLVIVVVLSCWILHSDCFGDSIQFHFHAFWTSLTFFVQQF